MPMAVRSPAWMPALLEDRLDEPLDEDQDLLRAVAGRRLALAVQHCAALLGQRRLDLRAADVDPQVEPASSDLVFGCHVDLPPSHHTCKVGATWQPPSIANQPLPRR